MGKKSPKTMKVTKSPKTATPPASNGVASKKKLKTPVGTPVLNKSAVAVQKATPKEGKKQTPKKYKELKRLSNNAKVSPATETPKKKKGKAAAVDGVKTPDVSMDTSLKASSKKNKKKNKQSPVAAAAGATIEQAGPVTPAKVAKKNKVEKKGIEKNDSPKKTGNNKKAPKGGKQGKQKGTEAVTKKGKKSAVPANEVVAEVSTDSKGTVTLGSCVDSIKEQAKKALEAVLEHTAKQKEDSLFKDLASRISLNIVCFKTPTVDQSFFNILLPHSIHPQEADVVLVIKHDKKKDEDYQEDELKSSLFKQNLLTEHGIKVREVLTLKQLRSEYSTMEAKRAFVKRIDALLVDKSIIKHVPEILGREVYRKKKFSIPVNMAEGHDIAEEIRTALKKTILHLSSKGTTTSVVVGNDELTANQLTENVVKVCQNVSKSFPGGWPNISKLAIEVANMPLLNIYFSKGGPQDVKKPVKRTRKMREVVEDEITTQPNKRVRVCPDGAIFVKQVQGEEDEEEN